MPGESGLKKRLWILLFLGPSLTGLLIFILGPVLYSLGLTLYDWNLLSPPRYVGLNNFAEVFQDTRFLQAFEHTLTYLVLYVPSVLVLAFGMALLLNQPLRGRAFFPHGVLYSGRVFVGRGVGNLALDFQPALRSDELPAGSGWNRGAGLAVRP